MNKDINKCIINILSEDGLKLYNEAMKHIIWDYQNIHYLLLYLDDMEDKSVIEAIKNYVIKTYQKDINEKLDVELLKALTDYHISNFDRKVLDFYDSYNDFENSIREILLSNDKDLEEAVRQMLNQLLLLQTTVFKTSDFILNFCAIQYIGRTREYISSTNTIKKSYVFLKENEINFVPGKHLNTYFIIEEFTNLFLKLDCLVSAYTNKDSNESEKFSLYDNNELAKKVIKDVLNNKIIKAVDIMNKICYKYDVYNLSVYFITYYTALYAKMLESSKYNGNFDKYILLIFKDVAEEFKTNHQKEIDYYSELINNYTIAKKIFSSDIKLYSEEVIKRLHSNFISCVSNIDRETFCFWYVAIINEIRDSLK